MNRLKYFVTLALALSLCLSMAACGGKDDETTPAVDSPTAEIEERLFSDPYMEGVEHEGLNINADTATEDQIQYAMAMLNMTMHNPIEDCVYLYRAWTYAKMTFADGTYYVPISSALPTCGDTDSMYINGYNCVNAYHGRIGVMTQLHVFQLSEERMAELKALPGWEELSESEVHLSLLMSEALADLELDLESEGVQYVHTETSAFAQCVYQTDDGPMATLYDIQIMDRDATGAYLTSITVVTGLTVSDESQTDYMDETDLAVLEEVMGYYNLNSWYE